MSTRLIGTEAFSPDIHVYRTNAARVHHLAQLARGLSHNLYLVVCGLQAAGKYIQIHDIPKWQCNPLPHDHSEVPRVYKATHTPLGFTSHSKTQTTTMSTNF